MVIWMCGWYKDEVSKCCFIVSFLLVGLCPANDLQGATFARDAETELNVDPPGSPDASGIFRFTRFTLSPIEDDFDFGGSLKLDGKLSRLEESPDQKSDASVAIEGDLEGEQLEVKTSGLTDSQKKEYDFSGTYHKLTDNELQRRAERRYQAADTWLNETYQQAREKLAAGSFADLKKREADWIPYRDYFAEQSAGLNPNTESLPKAVVRLQSLRELTLSRISFIRSLLDDSLPVGINAVYRDEYGGELNLEKDDGGIKFRLSVVRGPTLHTGDVSGRVVLKNGIGVYRDPDPPKDEAPAEIRFHVLNDRRVEIKAHNDGYLHGARAYFDGVYFKSGPLTTNVNERQ
jgi:uncharacterized protein YecT (DUF1311 family)